MFILQFLGQLVLALIVGAVVCSVLFFVALNFFAPKLDAVLEAWESSNPQKDL
jgi:hypothetical protein